MKIPINICATVLLCLLFNQGCKREDGNQNGSIPQSLGIRGKWQSSGDNISILLSTLHQIDSIFFDFRVDNTYIERQWDAYGALIGQFSGIYSQSRSVVGNIWSIRLEQQIPFATISEGIFEISGETMRLEIVQTFPDIQLLPPTPQGGFGSSNGGALGITNVQTYVKLH
ncbi:MAG: hypothetical protein ACK4KT_09260 [Thermaurantimonas sp.]